nr:MATE family efflux transporter [Anaeromicropila herbilytica]
MLIRKEIIYLVLPIMVEQCFTILLGVINTMMSGHIGKSAVAAIGTVDSVNNMFISFFAALSVGATVVVAQQIGQKKIEDANETVKQALFASLAVSITLSVILWILRVHLIETCFSEATDLVKQNAKIYLEFTLISYPFIAIEQISNGILRGSGDTRTPMTITIRMNIVNLILGYILIFGINLTSMGIPIHTLSFGIEGTALAIAIARVYGAILVLRVLLKGQKIVQLKNIFSFRMNHNIQGKIFSIGIPAGVESLLFNGGKFIIQIFVVAMGTNAISANTIGFSCANIMNVIGNSIALGATTIVGQYVGRRDIKGAKNNLKYMTAFATGLMMTFGLIFIPILPHIVALYTNDQDVIRIATTLLVVNSFAMFAWPSSFVLSAGLKGAGDTRYTMITALIGMWLFRIVVGYLLGVTLHIGVLGVWLGMYSDWVVRGAMYIRRLHGSKWMKHAIT